MKTPIDKRRLDVIFFFPCTSDPGTLSDAQEK